MEEFLKKFDRIKFKLIKKGQSIKNRLLIGIFVIIAFETEYLYRLWAVSDLIEKEEFIFGALLFPTILLIGYFRIPPLSFVPGNIVKRIYLQFKLSIILRLFKINQITAKYFPHTPVSRLKFSHSALFHDKIIKYHGDDGFSGRINKMQFQISEIHVSSTYHKIFNGFFIELKMEKNASVSPNTIILPLNKLNDKHRKQFPIEIEQINFTPKSIYQIQSTHKNIGHQNHIIKVLADFIEKTNKDVYISYSNAIIYIAIEINDNLFELDLSSKENKAQRLNEHITVFNSTIELIRNFSAIYTNNIV